MKKKNKILVLLPFAFYRNSGSAFSSFYRVKALSEINGSVDVVCYPNGQDLKENNINIVRYPRTFKFNDYEPGEWKKKLYYDIIIFIRTFFFLLKQKHDIVFIHGTLIYYFAAIIWLFPKTKFLATLHANIGGEFEKWGISKSIRLKSFASKIELACLNNYNKVLVISKTIKERLVNSGYKNEKIVVINNSVISHQIKEKEKSNKNEFIVLYTGTFVKIQNLKLLYQTAKILENDNILFLLIGGTDLEIKRDSQFLSENNIKNVILKKRIPHNELEHYYYKSDIVISPRVYGNEIPMKIYDYLNYGKCILAIDAPIHRSIINDEIAKLVEGNAENLANAILYLKTHTVEINKYEENAKAYFENNFSYEIMKKKYGSLLTTIRN